MTRRRVLVRVPLAGALAGSWAALALGAAPAAGRAEAIVTALATLAAVLAFRPLRDRLDERVAHRFDHAAHEALERIDRCVANVRAGWTAPETIEDELGLVLGDPRLALRYRLVSGNGHVDRHGRLASPQPAAGQAATPIRRRGGELGVLLHDPALFERRDLLHAALGAASLAIEVARLRADVAMQVDAVRASRAQIAAAEVTEREHVREDLERGAGRRLAALDRALARAECELGDTDPLLSAAIVASRSELGRTRDELDTLAGGFAAAALDDGLAAALHDLAGRMPMTVRVEAIDERVPAEVERTAYFVAAEAVANAIKHAEADAIRVGAQVRSGQLELRIADNGRGGATFAPGGGLRGLRERVEAIGGALALASSEAGTTIEAVLPCE